jgi:hypothetical protein
MSKQIGFVRVASVASLILAGAAAAPASAAVLAHLTASPTNFVGTCPAVITFDGKIKSTTKGEVKYKFIRSDGAIAPVETLMFREPGIQSVSTTWTLGGLPALPTYAGWEAIEIVAPAPGASNHAAFKIRCVKNPTVPGTPNGGPGSHN